MIFGEGRAQDAQLFSHDLPVVGAPAVRRLHDRAAGVEVVLVLNKLGDRVAQHVLFVGEVEIHGASPVAGGGCCS